MPSLSVLDAAKFSQLAYVGATTFNSAGYKSDSTKLQVPSGWSFIAESSYDPDTPYYYGVAFKNATTGQIAIANRGTIEVKEFAPYNADGQIILNKIPAEFPEALQFSQIIKQNNPGMELWQVGHSKGGAEAAYVATQDPSIQACTINAPGILTLKDANGNSLVNKTSTENINEYIVPGDVVSGFGEHVGIVHTLPVPDRLKGFLLPGSDPLDGPKSGLELFVANQLHSISEVLKNIDPDWGYTPCNEAKVTFEYYLDKIPNSTYASLSTRTDPETGFTIKSAYLYKDGNSNGILVEAREDASGNLLQTTFGDKVTDLNSDGGGVVTFLSDAVESIEKLFYDRDGKLTKAQINQTNVAASQIGELLGSMLGRTVASGNPVAEIAVGTLLGLTMSKVGSVLEAGFSGDLPTLIGEATKSSTKELGSKLGGTFSEDIITRLQGVGSSMLAAELAEALGITGFEGKVFTAVANGVTSQFIKETFFLVRNGTFTTETLFTNVLNSAEMIKGIQGSLGGIAGSQLASLFVTPKSAEGQVFASVVSSIGAIIGAAGGVVLGWVPFVGPFIGSFIGQLVGTWVGDLVSDQDGQAYAEITLSDKADNIKIDREWHIKEGNEAVSHKMGTAVVDNVNNMLDASGLSLDRDKNFKVQIGYYTNNKDRLAAEVKTNESQKTIYKYFNEGYTDRYGNTHDEILFRAVQSGVRQVVDAVDVVGGDVIMRRAFYASRDATGSTDDGLTRLGFDLQIAKDYRFFLDHEEVVKATMAAQKGSAYTAGWTATLLRANELGLNRGSVNDFKGGFYANLEANEAVQGPRGMAGGLAPERLAWIPDLDARDIAAKAMKTGDLILTSSDGLSSVRADHVFGPGEVVTLTGANSTATVDGSSINKPNASVILVKAGDGAKTVKGSANQGSIIVGGEGAQTLVGGNGNDWLRAGKNNKELLGGGGDDLLVAAGGSAIILDGGSGRNTYYLGPDDATVRISALDSKGSDTIITTLQGAFSGATSTINYSAKGGVSGLGMTKNSSFARIGADLHISAVTPDYRDGFSKIVIKNYFLSLNTIDAMVFSDGNLSSQQIWEKVGFRPLISETAWNTADETYDTIVIDTGDTRGDIYATVNTKTSDGSKSLFDVGIYDDGQMYTVAYDPNNDHDWTQWVSEYAASGSLGTDRITLDVKNADGSAVVIARGNGGVVAGSAGDDVLRSATAGSMLIGDRGNDNLTGAAGSDLLYGGSGDDRYVVGAGDQVFEFTDQGTDVVEATVSYALATGQSIEELRLAASTGTAALNLTGNERNNTLVGNAGANILNGGAGNDILRGGGGNDTYQIDSPDDQVFEVVNGGDDTVVTTRSYVLLAGQEVETLRLDSLTGNAARNLTGNEFANTLIGNTGVNVLSGGNGDDILDGGDGGADTIDGGGGSDTVSYASSSTRVTIALNDNLTWDGVSNDRLTSIENAIGSAFDDTLGGNGGANFLDGSAGNDILRGGAGDDSYRVNGSDDQVFESAGQGTDTVFSDNSFTLQAGQEIEVLRLATPNGTVARSLAGNEFANTLIGNAGDNGLSGGGGNDILDGGAGADAINGGDGIDTVSYASASRKVSVDISKGIAWDGAGDTLVSIENAIGSDFDDSLVGDANLNILDGGAGNDIMKGGLGNDIYVVDSTGDVVTENAGEGTDGVRTTLTSYTLGSEIENLRYIGGAAFTGAGNALANAVTGAGADDILNGGAGNDTLNGAGGDDRMTGGVGNDVYVADSIGDVVTEAAGEGTDELQTNLDSYNLGANVEILRYIGGGDFVGNGNALDNTLYGRGGDDTLNGGTGNDVLRGGVGDDTYRVDNGSDQVFEATGEGIDTILSDNSFTLAAGQEIEVLRLTSPTGTNARGLAGNEFANTLIGNAGDNGLNGGGGNDVIEAGAGVDTLNGGDGIDTVTFVSTTTRYVSINLDAGATWDGDAGDTLISIENATGSRFDDTLKGSTGNNTLDGGAGSDTLIGYGGSDTFAFRSALASTNVDRITDFASGDDRIMLENAYMGALSAGTLASGAFKNISQSAADADDRILYKQATGELFYDADGSGSTAAVRFAILDNKAALSYQDILVV